MSTKEVTVAFSDRERSMIEAVADQRGISFEEAASQLVSEGLADRVRRRTGQRPSGAVVPFRRGSR